MCAICAYMVTSANRFFRILRGSGVWLHGDTAIAARVAGDEMNESRLAFDMMVFPLPPKLPMFIVLLSFLDLIYTSMSNPGKLCPPSNFDVWAEWYALREEWYVSAANLGIFLQQ